MNDICWGGFAKLLEGVGIQKRDDEIDVGEIEVIEKDCGSFIRQLLFHSTNKYNLFQWACLTERLNCVNPFLGSNRSTFLFISLYSPLTNNENAIQCNSNLNQLQITLSIINQSQNHTLQIAIKHRCQSFNNMLNIQQYLQNHFSDQSKQTQSVNHSVRIQSAFRQLIGVYLKKCFIDRSKQNIIMTCTQEIAELCLAIHAFETSIACLKESLLDIKTVTDDLIWNHVVGQNSPQCTPQMLANYLTKHGLLLHFDHLRILVNNYSSLKNSCLTKSDLWQILKPLTIPFADQMMRNRAKNMVVAKNHQAHFKISDLVNEIVKRTLEFILIGQKMKKNIVQAQITSLDIQPLDPQHLQLFLNPYCPLLLIDDVRLIFRHIVRGRRVCFRIFYEYFIPVGHKSSKINPNHLKCSQVVGESKQISLLKTHIENSDFGTKKKNKKPLYLTQNTK